MKKSAIKIGEEYAVGRDKESRYTVRYRVRVLRTDVESRPRFERRFVGTEVVHLDDHGEPVRVKEPNERGEFVDSDRDHIRVVPNREIREVWSVYVARKKAERADERKAQQHKERVQADRTTLARQIAQALDRKGLPRGEFDDISLGLAAYEHHAGTRIVGYDILRGEVKADLRWIAQILGVGDFPALGVEPEEDD